MRISFRFRTIPFVATVLLVALGIALGQWQDRRAAGKIAMQEQLAARALEAPLLLVAQAGPVPTPYQRVRVTGSFVREWPVFLDNRPLNGRAGFYLLMPLRIEGSDQQVLVARGWLPRTGEYGRLPPFDTPEGRVTLEGIVKDNIGRVMQLGTQIPLTPKAIVQNVGVDQFAQASKLALRPFFIEQTDPVQAGELLVREWPAPALGADKHKAYAFQWYALALMALLFFVITGFRRGTKQDD
jgi:surfeit locus 1 family protein